MERAKSIYILTRVAVSYAGSSTHKSAKEFSPVYSKQISSRSGRFLLLSKKVAFRLMSPTIAARCMLVTFLAGGAVVNAQTNSAPPIAQCTSSFSDCAIPENVLLQFPSGFLAISGDAVLAPNLH